MLKKIISGGQTGADLGALIAAKKLGLKIGGTAPRGFRTENGSNLELGTIYNLTESHSREYPPRTLQNVKDSDGTLIFGNEKSPGCELTLKLCREQPRPCYIFPWISERGWIATWLLAAEDFRDWIIQKEITVLNCAGNRESKNPGIQLAIEQFLLQSLG